jgi:D-alanyl-D-alanine carboxypeptidase
MIRITITTLILFAALLGKSQTDVSALNEIVDHHIQHNYFEGTVLIADQGKIIFQKSAGLADRQMKTPIENDTKFSIASTTKMLTAILVLQLVEEGKISLDQNMQSLLPEFKIPRKDKITIHHLLLHISGLPNEKDLIYRSLKEPDAFVEATLKNKARSKFGQFNYANIDYVLLGLIVEKITGKAWEQVIRERIINKLDLQHTGFLRKGHAISKMAKTYSVSPKGNFTQDPDIHMENFFAAGCMYSTAADLLQIEQALYRQDLLSEKSKELMFTSYPQYNFTGYSVWTYNYPFSERSSLIMERRGGIMGANSVLVRFLESNQTIIILSNNNQFNPDSFGDPENLREALILQLDKG